MSVVLFVLGVASAVAGLVMVAFGIPNNEFSVGNTLIVAGTTSAVGGLILVGLSAAVAQLQQIAENLNHSAAQRDIPRPGRAPQAPADFFKSAERAPQGGAASVPFPSRPKPQTQDFDQDFGQEFAKDSPKDLAKDFNAAAARDEFAPASEAKFDAKRGDWESSRPLSSILRDEPEFDRSTDADEATLSPAAPSRHVPMFEPLKPADMPAPQRHPETVSRAPAAERPAPAGMFDGMYEARPEPRQESRQETRQETRPQPRQESRPAPAAPGGKSAAAEAWKPSQPFIPPVPAKPETKIRDQAPVPPRAGSSAAAEPRAAVLKSGTVDGMGYTLYVDGSIEAELPQGTLRFASIAELRSHLEQNS